MANEIVTVGEFTFNPATSEVAGPAEYMREQGSARLRQILSGEDVVFNYGCTRSPSVEVAVLVSLQTDYAGWKGTRQLLRKSRGR